MLNWYCIFIAGKWFTNDIASKVDSNRQQQFKVKVLQDTSRYVVRSTEFLSCYVFYFEFRDSINWTKVIHATSCRCENHNIEWKIQSKNEKEEEFEKTSKKNYKLSIEGWQQVKPYHSQWMHEFDVSPFSWLWSQISRTAELNRRSICHRFDSVYIRERDQLLDEKKEIFIISLFGRISACVFLCVFRLLFFFFFMCCVCHCIHQYFHNFPIHESNTIVTIEIYWHLPLHSTINHFAVWVIHPEITEKKENWSEQIFFFFIVGLT